MKSPFAVFRKHQKVAMVVLTGMAMFAFIILDAVTSTMQMSGRLPLLLVALLAACAGAVVFWLLGSSGGKGKEWAATGAVVGLAAAIIVPRIFPEGGYVNTTAGSLTQDELHALIQKRRMANQVIRDVYAVAHKYPERLTDVDPSFASLQDSPYAGQFLSQLRQNWEIRLNSYLFGPRWWERGIPALSETHSVFTWLLSLEADDMGIAISNDAINDYLRQISDDQITGPDLTRIRKSYNLSESQVYDILRYELKARRAAELLEPNLLPTPENYWDVYRRLNVRQELAVTAVPVEKFIEADSQPASDKELQELFEQYKSRVPVAGEPGFLEPRKVQFAYLEASFDDVRREMFPDEITDADLQQYYEQHRDEFRNPAFDEQQADEAAGPAGSDAANQTGSAESGPILPNAPLATEVEPAPTPPFGSGDQPSTPPADAKSPPGDGQASLLPAGENLFDVAVQDEPEPVDAPSSDAGEAGKPTEASDAAAPAGANDAQAPRQPGEPSTGDAQPKPRRIPLPPPLPEDPVPEYRSFESVQEDIRSRIQQQRDEAVRQKLDRAIQAADRELSQLAARHRAPRSEAERLSAKEVSARLEEYAGQNDLRYVVTPLVTQQELSNFENYPVGLMTDPNSRTSIVEQLFGSGPDVKYVRIRAQDITGDHVIGWKIDDQASRVPEFNEEGLRDRVLEAWRRRQALPKAEQRADKLAEAVRQHPEQDMQAALAGQTLTGADGGQELDVRQTRSFSWLRQSSAADPGSLMPSPEVSLSDIDAIENEGHEFMQTVFNDMNEGDVAVVPNRDKSVYYVVQVQNRSSASDVGRQILHDELLRAPLFASASPYNNLLGSDRFQLLHRWQNQLWEKYDVRSQQPLDSRP